MKIILIMLLILFFAALLLILTFFYSVKIADREDRIQEMLGSSGEMYDQE